MSLRLLLICLFILLLPAQILASGGEEGRDELYVIVVLGDSLTAGYGLPRGDAFPTRLETALLAEGENVTVINSGVSGDTTAGGLNRIDWVLADDPDLVIVALGANDALRGVDPETTRANLAAIIEKILVQGCDILLAGMKAPRNLGAIYYTKFDSIYPELAAEYKIPLYPFFLDGVATDPTLNQGDGIHPNRDGVEVIVERIVPVILVKYFE